MFRYETSDPEKQAAIAGAPVGRWLGVNLGVMLVLFALALLFVALQGEEASRNELGIYPPSIIWMFIVALQTGANALITLGYAARMILSTEHRDRSRHVAFAALITTLLLPLLGFGLCIGGAGILQD